MVTTVLSGPCIHSAGWWLRYRNVMGLIPGLLSCFVFRFSLLIMCMMQSWHWKSLAVNMERSLALLLMLLSNRVWLVVVTHWTSSPSLSLPPALLPHDPAEEEGAGPRRGLQQSGVSPSSASRHIHWREKEQNQPTKEEQKTCLLEEIHAQPV